MPERRGSSFGGYKPSATLAWEGASAGSLSLPACVGRRLEQMGEEEGFDPRSAEELVRSVRALEGRMASSRLAELASRREVSTQEARERLQREGFPPEVASSAVRRAAECGLVDDARFADTYVRSKLTCGWGAQRIERELSRRGIDASALEGWPYEYFDPEDERERALELASRRRLTGKNDYAKIVRFLVGRGFGMGVACDAARQVLEGA
jgi:regulatory protein